MPRHEQQVTLEGLLSWEERLVLTILTHQLNIIREALDLPHLGAEDVRQEVRAYVRAHPRGETR